MLDATTYRSSSAIVKQPAVPLINGPGRRALKHLTKSQRAALAVAVTRGEVGLQPTLGVVSRALGVPRTYIETAAKLSPDQLRQVRQGWCTLANLKPATPPTPIKTAMTPDDVAAWWWTASEADRAAVVGKVGVVSTWDALAKNLV
jgi:hypothetical protein